MDKRLNIAFLWHMHQPIYKDPATGEFTLPWVLFHGTKDYYDMAAILEEFPDVHQTFNLVPCLIEQLKEYGSGKAKDRYRDLSAKKASELGREDKIFILQYFFQANWDNMIRPFPRYWELLRKRGVSNTREDIQHALRYFGEQDYLDLQVLFNLVWIDPLIRQKDSFLSSLVTKSTGYTEEEKEKLLEKQIEIIKMIIPKYAELEERGIIEVSTTPYYHPILPLLCDSDSAKEAMPYATLPKKRFMHPEDALAQVRNGLVLFKKTFGRLPNGMWPSEGSVSMDMLPIAAGEGIKWLATDEEILSNSLKRPIRRDGAGNCYDTFLYKPYTITVGDNEVTLIFRDHVLSDLIGFDYAKMDPENAAEDMVRRLSHIHNMLERPEEHLVSIILDGENAWEGFRNDGRDFLSALYSKLSSNNKLRAVTVSEFLERSKSRERLNWLYPGSWISHNFKIWIGHHEDNTAWDYIHDVRDALVKYEKSLKGTPEYDDKKEAIAEAWEKLYAAEGSDWFWWYGEEHSTMLDEHFDTLFRLHIKRIYELIEMEPPESLESPISTEEKAYVPPVVPTAYIHPVIDGTVSNYFEWLSAGRLERQFYGSAMHKELQESGLIDGISYGFSTESLFFRFDYVEGVDPREHDWGFTITFIYPKAIRINASISGKTSKISMFEKNENGKWVQSVYVADIASDSVVELGIPFKAIGVAKGDETRLYISIDAGDKGIERWPVKGFLVFDIPTEDFEQQNWIV